MCEEHYPQCMFKVPSKDDGFKRIEPVRISEIKKIKKIKEIRGFTKNFVVGEENFMVKENFLKSI